MLHNSLEIPARPDPAGSQTGRLAGTLESLVAAWDDRVEQARAAERRVADRAAAASGPGDEAIEALRRSHRALVETLERSIAQLEALQARTAGIAQAMSGPAGGLCLSASGPTEFPTSHETEIIDATNRQALATLDVSRWRPLKRRRAVRQAARRGSAPDLAGTADQILGGGQLP